MPGIEYGHIVILINDMISKRHISKNFLTVKANLQRTQLNAYCNNKVKRLDFDVLSRICYVLDCDISDILRYIQPKKREKA